MEMAHPAGSLPSVGHRQFSVRKLLYIIAKAVGIKYCTIYSKVFGLGKIELFNGQAGKHPLIRKIRHPGDAETGDVLRRTNQSSRRPFWVPVGGNRLAIQRIPKG